MSTATVDAGRHVASAAARRPNLAVAALPLGAHAQQSAGLEPRQLFGYGRSDWSSKLTQDWDPKRLRTSGPQAHRQGLRSASASRRGEATSLSLAVLRRRVEERLIGEELDVKLVLDRAARLACGVCAPDADQVIWLGTWPRC
jgi:hypothetical protein